MVNIKNKFMALSIKLKIVIIFSIVISISGIVMGAYFITNSNTVETAQEEIVYEEVIENIEDEQIDSEEVDVEEESEEEEEIEEPQEEVVVKYKNTEVVIPKSTVAPVNSSEDAEKNKKNSGEKVSQEQANAMFQNEGKQSKGIDVSAHQGKINWKEVKSSGVDFAIIRVGFRGQTEGKIYEDTFFKTNVMGAVANGIKVGIYFYSTAINEKEALEEAAWVASKIAPYQITYPVVYDFEDFGRYRCSEVDGNQATKNAQIYLNYIKSKGYEPMMYANKNDITTRMSRSSFSCKFWLAHYTTQTDYKGNISMWQYTSKGSVPGIAGNVDMNVAYFSYGTTVAPKHTHNYTEIVKGSEKEATCEEEGAQTMRCSCGDTLTKTFPKLEHVWKEWTTVIPATESKAGLLKRVCTVCNKEETKEVEKLVDNSKKNNTSNENTTNSTNITSSSNDTKVNNTSNEIITNTNIE